MSSRTVFLYTVITAALIVSISIVGAQDTTVEVNDGTGIILDMESYNPGSGARNISKCTVVGSTVVAMQTFQVALPSGGGAIQLVPNDTPCRFIEICNRGGDDFFIGTSSVTTSTGFQVDSSGDECFEFARYDDCDEIYGIDDSGGQASEAHVMIQ